MRLATWNCARGPLARKREALDALGPDVVVMTEASPPDASMRDVLWFGEGRFGVAMYARPPYRVKRLRRALTVPCVYPVAVIGPVCFTLIGVWTWPAPTYKSALVNGLDAYRGIRGARVVAGDFNGNVDFDKPRGRMKWSHCFDRLAEEGLVSAYHRDRTFGREPDATHYFLWREERRFHLDYCFVPRQWTITHASVGSYTDWKTLSDHRPVIVDVTVDVPETVAPP